MPQTQKGLWICPVYLPEVFSLHPGPYLFQILKEVHLLSRVPEDRRRMIGCKDGKKTGLFYPGTSFLGDPEFLINDMFCGSGPEAHDNGRPNIFYLETEPWQACLGLGL